MVQIEIDKIPIDFLAVVRQAADGEIIVIVEDQCPIAEIRPTTKAPTAPRALGLGIGEGKILPSFFEPLPDDILRGFYGESS